MVRKLLSLLLLTMAVLALTISIGAVSAQDTITLIEWDYWVPPSNQADVWGQLLSDCGAENNIVVESQPSPRNDLITKVLLAAQQQQLPDLLMIDNPDLQQVASTGALAPHPGHPRALPTSDPRDPGSRSSRRLRAALRVPARRRRRGRAP